MAKNKKKEEKPFLGLFRHIIYKDQEFVVVDYRCDKEGKTIYLLNLVGGYSFDIYALHEDQLGEVEVLPSVVDEVDFLKEPPKPFRERTPEEIRALKRKFGITE